MFRKSSKLTYSILILFLLLLIYSVSYVFINTGSIGYKVWQWGYPSLAIKTWQFGSDIGDDESSYRLGMSYWAGKGVAVDYDVALDYLKKVDTIDPRTESYYLYALADINFAKGNYSAAEKVFLNLCKKGLEDACTRLQDLSP